jgi:hypothetical protein
VKHLVKLISRNSGDSITSCNTIKYETEIADLKKKLVLALQGLYTMITNQDSKKFRKRQK